MAIAPGTQIDHYHIIEPLGQGGMAEVYKAFDTRLEREVAVKVIRRNAFSPDVLERVLKRFDREAKSLAKLTHPNIVSIIDYGEHDGSPYLVMPFLPGGTLKARLGKPMPYTDAAALLSPIADALAYAHQKGIVHRDVKPGNILITEGGAPMLTDFGIARLLENEDTQTLTGTGVGVGTPEYMAPEQGLGREVDGRADIYSLGIVFYELVTGQKPYTADTPMAVILKQSTEPLPCPSTLQAGIPDHVDKILFTALAKKPEDRYQSMQDFEKSLRSLLSEISQKMVWKTKTPTRIYEVDISSATETVSTFIDDPKESQSKSSIIPENKIPLDDLPHPTKDDLDKKKNLLWAIISFVGFLGFFLVLRFMMEKIQLSGQQNITPSAIASVSVITTLSTQTSEPTATAMPELGIGSIMVSPIDGMTLMYVPAGNFLMGSPDGVGYDVEHPQHTVYLDAYWIDQTEVTNAMFEKCVAAGACTPPSQDSSYTRGSYFGNSTYADFPVIYVDWYQADTYCRWAGRQLPTEAQWEKAARGTDGSTYPWGNQAPSDSLANYDDQIIGDTTAVGSFPAGASPYGVLDMAGNVWEWVSDWNDGSFYSSSPTSNPTGPALGNSRLLRGGSYEGAGRSAFRYWVNPGVSVQIFGFRCSFSQ